MASTIPLSRTILLTQQFCRNAPLTFSAAGPHAATNDPAFSNADWVRQFILAPPFAWRWNRANIAPIVTSIGITDYSQTLSSFGWIEKANLIFPVPSGGAGKSKELVVVQSLAQEVTINEPTTICAFTDNDAGTITFRVTPAPNQQYTLQIMYQMSAPLFQSSTDTWGPIPDYLSFLYNQGMAAKAFEYLGDDRYGGAMMMFLRQVIATNQGLTENEVNLFLQDKIAAIREQQNSLGTAQNARAGRGGFQG